MDFGALKPDKEVLIKNFSPGRGGKKIQFIVLHHNAGRLSTEQCFQVWQNRQASAHYQVETDGTIGRLVADVNTAWHCGNFEANQKSIGVEHANTANSAPWTLTNATVDAGAHLVAALCHKYGLGTPTWGVNVFPHRHFMATVCPGELDGRQRKAYLVKAVEYYQSMANSTSKGAVAKPATPVKIVAGCRVKVQAGAKVYGTRISFSPHVYRTVYTVMQIRGDRAVIWDGKTVIGAVSAKMLKRV